MVERDLENLPEKKSEHAMSACMAPPANLYIATWGTGLVLALLGQAVYRLTPIAVEPWLDGSMNLLHQILFFLFMVFNAYAEGYRAFQKRFSPRVVARAFYLGRHPNLLHILLALPFCMSFFHSTKRQMTISWLFVGLLTCLIIGVRLLPQPWRGIIDGGVVVGLVWGMVSIVLLFIRGLYGNPPPVPDLPSGENNIHAGTECA